MQRGSHYQQNRSNAESFRWRSSFLHYFQPALRKHLCFQVTGCLLWVVSHRQREASGGYQPRKSYKNLCRFLVGLQRASNTVLRFIIIFFISDRLKVISLSGRWLDNFNGFVDSYISSQSWPLKLFFTLDNGGILNVREWSVLVFVQFRWCGRLQQVPLDQGLHLLDSFIGKKYQQNTCGETQSSRLGALNELQSTLLVLFPKRILCLTTCQNRLLQVVKHRIW